MNYSEHMTQLERESPDNLFERHQQYFPSWFEQHVSSVLIIYY